MRIRGWLLSGLLAAAIAGSANAKQVTFITEGLFKGGAEIDDSGYFRECRLIRKDEKNGIGMGFMVARDNFVGLVLANLAWDYPDGQFLPITLSFDGGPAFSLRAKPSGGKGMAIDLDNTRILERFRHALRMQWSDGTNSLTFDLTGTESAVSRAQDCVREQLALEASGKSATGQPKGAARAETGAAAGSGIFAALGGDGANAGTGKGAAGEPPLADSGKSASAAAPPAAGTGKSAPAGAPPPASGSASAAAKPATADKKPDAKKEEKPTIGTGIIVSSAGHVLTHPWIEECKTIQVRRPGEAALPAFLVVADEVNGLGLLKVASGFSDENVARFATGRGVRAGDNIAVYGFPLSDALSATGNIVGGIVSSLAGVGNDINRLQITAPIQPGNEGAPLLDYRGAVAGMVMTQLDPLKTAANQGAFPQNVNFATKANVLADFLAVQSVAYKTFSGDVKLDLPAVAEVAKRFTVQVLCEG